MTSPVNAFLTAIHARLTGDAEIAALVGEAIHDRRLSRAAMPSLVIGQVEARDFSTASEGGLEVFVTLEAWSATGRRETEEIAGAVRSALDDADLALETATLVSLRHQRTSSRRETKTGLFVAEVRMRAVVE